MRQGAVLLQDRRRFLRRALATFGAVILICALIIHFGQWVPVVRPYTGTIVAAIFLYVPILLLRHFRENKRDYGLTVQPVGRNLFLCCAMVAIIFPPFIVAFYMYYSSRCANPTNGVCRRFIKNPQHVVWRSPYRFWEQAAGHLVVGIAEEVFFRGYLQTEFDRVWPQRWRIFGAQIGPSLLVTSALFAVGHLMVEVQPARLAVFFPALLFGWMRAKSGSVAPGALFHTLCNMLNICLYTVFFI